MDFIFLFWAFLIEIIPEKRLCRTEFQSCCFFFSLWVLRKTTIPSRWCITLWLWCYVYKRTVDDTILDMCIAVIEHKKIIRQKHRNLVNRRKHPKSFNRNQQNFHKTIYWRFRSTCDTPSPSGSPPLCFWCSSVYGFLCCVLYMLFMFFFVLPVCICCLCCVASFLLAL